jgi:hypothetical protein
MSVSVDGFINDREGSFDWTPPSDGLFEFRLEQVSGFGAYLLGRRLYEAMLVSPMSGAHYRRVRKRHQVRRRQSLPPRQGLGNRGRSAFLRPRAVAAVGRKAAIRRVCASRCGLNRSPHHPDAIHRPTWCERCRAEAVGRSEVSARRRPARARRSARRASPPGSESRGFSGAGG